MTDVRLYCAGVLEQLGVPRSDQRRDREDQLQRRRELKKERVAKGLSDDDAILDVIVEEEEVVKKPKKLVSLLPVIFQLQCTAQSRDVTCFRSFRMFWNSCSCISMTSVTLC